MSGETMMIGALETLDRGEEAAAAVTSQYVAFSVGEQDYGIDIISVREIRAWTGTTSLPNTAGFVLGVINLRGVILPIVDLRARFGQGDTEPTTNHVVVIVAISGRLVGLLVDAVLDILTVVEEDISPIPDTGGDERNPYLNGLITQNDRMIATIALERLVDQAIVL